MDENPYMPTPAPQRMSFWGGVFQDVIAGLIVTAIIYLVGAFVGWIGGGHAEGYIDFALSKSNWIIARYWPLMLGGLLACLAMRLRLRLKSYESKWNAALDLAESKGRVRQDLLPLKSLLEKAVDFRDSARLFLDEEDKTKAWLDGIKDLNGRWSAWLDAEVRPKLTIAQGVELDNRRKPIASDSDPGTYNFSGGGFIVITSSGSNTPESRMRGIISGSSYLVAELLQCYPELSYLPEGTSKWVEA